LWRRGEAFNTSFLERRHLFDPGACWYTQRLPPRPLQRLTRTSRHRGRTAHIRRRACGPRPALLLPPRNISSYFSNVFVSTLSDELPEADAGAEGSGIAVVSDVYYVPRNGSFKKELDLLDGFFIVLFTVGILRILTELSAKYDVTLQTLLLICYAITIFIRHAKRQSRSIQPLFSSRQVFFKEFPVAVSL